MAIFRPFVYSSSLFKYPVAVWGVLLCLAVAVAFIYFPFFLYGLMVNTDNWKELSSMAFIKAIVAPSTLSAFATFSVGCGVMLLFYSSECCISRIYENFGRAYVICEPIFASSSDTLKACSVFGQYAAGGIAALIALGQHSEGVKDICNQVWPMCTQASDECVIAEAYRVVAIITVGQAVVFLSAVCMGALMRFAEFWVLYTLTRKCVQKHGASAQYPIQCELQSMKDKQATIV